MGEHKRTPQAKQPLAHQITVVTMAMKNGTPVSAYTIHPINDLLLMLEETPNWLVLQTGDDSESDANAHLVINKNEINVITVADVKQPSNIIKPNFKLQ